MNKLRKAIAELEEEDDDLIDERELSSLVDRLQAKLCRVVAAVKLRGDYQLEGYSAVTWVAKQCQMSRSAAADRLCVGAQLEKMPRIAQALRAGEIGFQSASVICHLQERVEQAGSWIDSSIDQEAWVENARCFSIKDLSILAASTWHSVDPAGFNLKVEEAHERRQLFINECGDMYRVDGWLELSSGAVLKTAIDALAHPLGKDDYRSPKQRRADAVVELAHHLMDQGRLRKRNGVRPNVSVHTTIEGLKGELGAPASELANGTPISSQTVQRLACDGLLHRVLKADSMVIDVGRAHRTAQPSQWRALKARHQTCAAPGCDRPINWTQAHHVDFWEHGGRTDHGKMLPLCCFHHRLVHEGDWRVVMVGERVEFIPPDRPVMIRRRWGERWAA